MTPLISHEKPRGCGYRKEGGLYLVSRGSAKPCGMLPMPLTICPTCSAGIKPSRGWTWVDAEKLFEGRTCSADTDYCQLCPARSLKRVGLLWVGEKFYSRPEDFNKEAEVQGISRRIAMVPREFVIGETWILLAHRKCIENTCDICQGHGRDEGDENPCKDCKGSGKIYTPGIFGIFKPGRIEQVVSETISEEECEKLDKRSITPVIVKRLDAAGTPELPFTTPLNVGASR